jgi:hypothetical protein
MKHCLAPALFLVLAACQTAGTGPDNPPLSTPPDLPKDYRVRAALHIVSGYVRDALGPAEIMTTPFVYSNTLGGSTFMTVRYPVRKTRLFGGDAPGMRCITIQSRRGLGTGGATRLTLSVPRADPDDCLPDKPFEPYPELEQLATKLRACKERGEERCLLTTNMPDADAKKLINQRR